MGLIGPSSPLWSRRNEGIGLELFIIRGPGRQRRHGQIRQRSADLDHCRAVSARKPSARARGRLRAEGDRRAAEDRPRLQDLLRQGQPHQRLGAARPRLGAVAPDLRRDPVLARPAGADRCARCRAMRRRRTGRRHPADPGLPVPADRSTSGRGRNRQGRQRQEGAIPRALGHDECRRQDHQRQQSQRARHRARRLLRLQHAGLRHARCRSWPARPVHR